MTFQDFLKDTVKQCKNKAEFCRALDLNTSGGNYNKINNIIKKYNLDISHFIIEPWNKNKAVNIKKLPLNEILIKNSPHKSTYSLKNRLINEGIKEHKCEKCGYTKKIEMHHINGDSTDNRLENLQILCPTCHSLTNNYRGKNVKGRRHNIPEAYILTPEEIEIHNKAKRIKRKLHLSSISQAIELIKNNDPIINDIDKKEYRKCIFCGNNITNNKNLKYCSSECYNKDQSKNIPIKQEFINNLINYNVNFTKIGKIYNVTDNTIKKWCRKYELPQIKEDIITYLNNNYSTNIKIKKKKGDSEKIQDKNLIKDLYLEGYTKKDISDIIGFSVDYVRKVLKEFNIKNMHIHKILQYDKNYNLLNTFNNISDAFTWLYENHIISENIITPHINNCCNNKAKTALGFIWRYKEKESIENIIKRNII